MSFSLSHGKTLDVTGYGLTVADLPPIAPNPHAPPPYRLGFDPRRLFGEARAALPLEMEIGSGKGTFLVQHAALLPDVNFLGLEYAHAFWRYAADRVRRHAMANVRLLHAEADMFVRNYVPDASLRQVHIYFPDPWPKSRHHKRRLIQAPFLRELHRVLSHDDAAEAGTSGGGTSGGGRVRLATDHEDYFHWMQEHAAQVSELFTVEPFAPPTGAGQGELVGSNFERKYRREGRPFFSMTLRRSNG